MAATLGPEGAGLEPGDLPGARVAGPDREEQIGTPSVGPPREGVVVGTGHVVHHLRVESLESLAQRRTDLVEPERDRHVDTPPREPGRAAELVTLADRGDRAPAIPSTRWNASRVAGPAMPSTVSPALRWNSRSADEVSGPRMPSSRPRRSRAG